MDACCVLPSPRAVRSTAVTDSRPHTEPHRRPWQGAAVRPLIPSDVVARACGWHQDTRVSCDDPHSDPYCASAHLRQLIERVTGVPNYEGPLTPHKMHDIAAAHHGSGPTTLRYGDAAPAYLTNAVTGTEALYF